MAVVGSSAGLVAGLGLGLGRVGVVLAVRGAPAISLRKVWISRSSASSLASASPLAPRSSAVSDNKLASAKYKTASHANGKTIASRVGV